MNTPKVSIDGGKTWFDMVESVRIEYKDPADDGAGDLLLNVTHEGVIIDITDSDGEISATGAFDLEELVGHTR